MNREEMLNEVEKATMETVKSIKQRLEGYKPEQRIASLYALVEVYKTIKRY